MFINPRIKFAKYRGNILYNSAVNLSLCKSVQKGRIDWYPDNTGIPSISFIGCDVEWAYNYEKERDDDFEAIANNKWGEHV